MNFPLYILFINDVLVIKLGKTDYLLDIHVIKFILIATVIVAEEGDQ